jgi:hypothetical protein
LKSEQEAGRIDDLRVHQPYQVSPRYTDSDGKPHRAIFYYADFEYMRLEDDVCVIEDVKSKPTTTALFKLKWSLMHKIMGKNKHVELRIIES